MGVISVHRNPKIIMNRINKTQKMKNGMKATIIAYRKSDDIDVQFEDGTIVKHKSYQHFTQGHIRNTNFKYIG